MTSVLTPKMSHSLHCEDCLTLTIKVMTQQDVSGEKLALIRAIRQWHIRLHPAASCTKTQPANETHTNNQQCSSCQPGVGGIASHVHQQQKSAKFSLAKLIT